jgi:hypothetical protein
MAAKPATETPMAKPPLASTAAYLKIRDLIYRTSGIYQSDKKLHLLMSRFGRSQAI